MTITGRSPRATSSSTRANHIVVIVEERDNRIDDDALAWDRATGPTGYRNTITMTATATSSKTDFVTWKANVVLPAGNTKPLRLTFEEYERIEGSAATSSAKGRLAWTESVQITQLGT